MTLMVVCVLSTPPSWIWEQNPFYWKGFSNEMVFLSHRDQHTATQNPFLITGTFSLVVKLGKWRHPARSCWWFWFQTQGERCSEVIRLIGQDAEAGMRGRKLGRVILAIFGLWLLSILMSPRWPCVRFLEAEMARFPFHMPPLYILFCLGWGRISEPGLLVITIRRVLTNPVC